jgi:hypothetical protein
MLKDLWKRRLLVALAVIVAVAAGIFALNRVNSPSTPEARGSSEVLVDSAQSPIAGSKRDITGLIVRAGVFARLMAGGDIVREIAQKAGVPANQIEVVGPQPFPEEVPGAEAPETRPYQLAFTEVSELPIVAISTKAPTVDKARALAAAAPEALRTLIQTVQQHQDTPDRERVELRELGPAQAAAVGSGSGAKIAVLVFIVVLALGLLLVLGIPRFLAAWRSEGLDERLLFEAPDISEPTASLIVPNGNGARNGAGGRRARRQG